jgi:sugar phosphate isomerase/epimerase
MSKVDRREFIKAGGLGVATIAAAVLPAERLMGYPLGIPVGLQLMTIWQLCDKDLANALKQVSAIGYRNVEVGGTNNLWGRRPSDVRKMFCDNCLVCISTPCTVEMMQSNWQKYVDQFSELGTLYAVLSGFSAQERSTLDVLRRMADLLNRSGEQCQKSALRLGFHVHNTAYQVDQGVVVFDELLRRTDPRYVNMELDCFWAVMAGADPVAYFKRYPGRFPLLHIKDMRPGFPHTTKPLHVTRNPFTEVGRGIIDWRRIFAAAREGGLQYYMVEQDECNRPPIDAVKISYNYLRNLIVA